MKDSCVIPYRPVYMLIGLTALKPAWEDQWQSNLKEISSFSRKDKRGVLLFRFEKRFNL